jgi:excisionase family DNA binding protein
MNDVLNENEVAEILDCEPATVKEKARNGELPAVKFGRLLALSTLRFDGSTSPKGTG